ncbi:hypothetical protein M9Y10_034198 [Tritrichomonas musculus]|uniref:LisH domain-containing protein n=1 Tax=Tritrichomonas musculus TaxID=1915356 RepID=A0ABR2KEB5_9EUKA
MQNESQNRENYPIIDQQNNQSLYPIERHPILTDDEKYYIEKQIFLSILRKEMSSNCIRPPSLQELSTLSYGVRKIFEQNYLNNNNNNNYFNNLNSDPINTGSMARILTFFSKYLDHRSPVDCARIWKLVQGKKEDTERSSEFQSSAFPEALLAIKYHRNSTVCVNKRKIAAYKKNEISLASIDSKNKEVLNVPDTSLVIPYIDSFAALTPDGKIYIIKDNDEQKLNYELFFNAEKPLSDFRISQTISPFAAALTNESKNIIFGQETSFKEYRFADKVTQFQISSTKLCFSTKSSFYVLDNDRIAVSFEYAKNMNDFKIFRNDNIVISYGDNFYDLFDLRTPEKIFFNSSKSNDKIFDCQISPINNLFSFSQQKYCSIYDLRNPVQKFSSFIPTQNNSLHYKVKWIGDDRLIATADDEGFCSIIDICSNSPYALRSYSLTSGRIMDLNTTDDTIIITQPFSISIIQMNSRPLLISSFM